MSDITIHKVNEVYIRVESDPSIKMELQEEFSFEVPGAKFMPKVKSGFWDGILRLYNPYTGLIYAGLKRNIQEFCDERDYTFESRIPILENVDTQEFIDFIKSTNPKYIPRDFQFNAFRDAINNQRGLYVSPTASGKSFIIYLITRWINHHNGRILIVVPTTSLVNQMASDFVEYNRDVPLDIHTIMAGHEKTTKSPITISTWQSIYKLPESWFAQFDGIIGDEVHTFKATSLKGMMEKATQTPYRLGFTGTLDGTLTNELVLQGLFGPTNIVTTYQELHNNAQIADMSIGILLLKYDKVVKKEMCEKEFKDEYEFLIENQARNAEILRLTSHLKGNILLLFERVEHGKLLHTAMKKAFPNHDNFLVYGKVDVEEREQVRQFLEKTNTGIAVCSYKTFSTGVNVKNLHHIVFASPTGKSQIRVLQSIGRGLRLHDSKTKLRLWDIADDLRSKGWMNHTFRHLKERIGIYNKNGFRYSFHEKEIKT